MCRSIKTLRSQLPTPTTDEVNAAALQYVRKISGYRSPSQRNRDAFEAAVAAVASATTELLGAIGTPVSTSAP